MFNLESFEELYNALFQFCGKILWAIVILIVAKVVVILGNKFISSFIKRSKKIKSHNASDFSNFETMLKTIFKYVIYIIAILTIFTRVFELMDAASVLATVGVGGVALSFGAQSLVKDIISGFFILLEKQMEVGDFVYIGTCAGTVKEVDLRCVKLETFKGEIVYIPYGEIRQVTNKSKLDSTVAVEIPVSYKQNLTDVLAIAEEITQEYTNEKLTSGLGVQPPTSLDEKTYMVRILGKCKPCADWDIERDIRKAFVEKANARKLKLGFNIEK